MGDVLAVKTAMTVAGSYDYTPTFMMIICGVLLIIWNALAQFVFVRVKGKKKRAAVFSVSAGAVAAFIACFYNFMISGLSLEVNLWDPTTSYAENGYILSSAISIKYLVKKAPGGYSQAKIQEICDKYVDSEKGSEWGLLRWWRLGTRPADEYYSYHERESFRSGGGRRFYDKYRLSPGFSTARRRTP